MPFLLIHAGSPGRGIRSQAAARAGRCDTALRPVGLRDTTGPVGSGRVVGRQAGTTSRSAGRVPAATIPAVMAEGLKPLKVSHKPSESSHRATGTVAITDHAETCPMTPKNAAMVEVMSRGAPMSPIRGMARGTRPDRYIKVPSKSALIHGI